MIYTYTCIHICQYPHIGIQIQCYQRSNLRSHLCVTLWSLLPSNMLTVKLCYRNWSIHKKIVYKWIHFLCVCGLLSSSITMFEFNKTNNILYIVPKICLNLFIVIFCNNKYCLKFRFEYGLLLNLCVVNSMTIIQVTNWWNINNNQSCVFYPWCTFSLLPLFWSLHRAVLLKKCLFLKVP